MHDRPCVLFLSLTSCLFAQQLPRSLLGVHRARSIKAVGSPPLERTWEDSSYPYLTQFGLPRQAFSSNGEESPMSRKNVMRRFAKMIGLSCVTEWLFRQDPSSTLPH